MLRKKNTKVINPLREMARPEWFYPMPGGGGGESEIEFTITSVTTAGSGSPYNGLKVATVDIEGASCNLSSLIGTSVDVVDHSGCILNEDDAELVGRWGWADKKVFLSLASGAGPGELTPCHYSIKGLCCPADADQFIDGGDA